MKNNCTQHSVQSETAVKGAGVVDDGGRRDHTTCGGCECGGNHSALDTPAGSGAQDWEHWEWTGGDMRLVLTMQQRRWNDNHVGYHKDMDYERGAEMVAAAYTPDDTTAGRWALAGLWVVRNPTPDSVQQFMSRWLDDGIQLASSVMRSRYDYPVFFDRILLSWDDTVKAIEHAIQGEGWRVDWEWDFNRGADGRVVLTNTKDESAPALVFVDPARCQQAGAGSDMGIRGGADPSGGDAWGSAATGSNMAAAVIAGADADLSGESGSAHGSNETANTAAAHRVIAGSGVENAGGAGGVPTASPRATINDGTTRADGVSPCGGTNSTGGGVTVNTPGGGHSRDKETPCQLASQSSSDTGDAARCSSCGVSAIGAGAPTTRVPDEDAYTLIRRGDTGTTGPGHAGTASVHGDALAVPGGEKADATESDGRHDEGSCSPGILGAAGYAGAGNVWEHSPTPAPNPAPGTNSGGNRGCGASKEDSATIGVAGTTGAGGHEGGGITSDDGPVGVSYGVPDGGFTPIVYVDYGHQEQDWFEVYGPDYTDDEGELLPEVAAAARHSIPAGGGVVPVSLGSFLQVIDVVKWWLGVDGNTRIDALGALRNAMKGVPC